MAFVSAWPPQQVASCLLAGEQKAVSALRYRPAPSKCGSGAFLWMPSQRVMKVTTLTKRPDFVRVQTRGQSFSRRHLVLLIAPGIETQTRLGFTVSGRVGGAVVRNRVRRRLREIVRAQSADLSPGWDHVLIARPKAPQADFAVLKEEIRCLLGKASAWVSARES